MRNKARKQFVYEVEYLDLTRNLWEHAGMFNNMKTSFLFLAKLGEYKTDYPTFTTHFAKAKQDAFDLRRVKMSFHLIQTPASPASACVDGCLTVRLIRYSIQTKHHLQQEHTGKLVLEQGYN